MLDQIKKRYGMDQPPISTQVKVNEYIGMYIDFSVSGKVKIKMFYYIKDINNEFI